MKKPFFFIFSFFFLPAAYSQYNQLHKKFFRLYADNDGLFLSNRSEDWGYTGGNRIDLFYNTPGGRSDFFSRFNQLAGQNSVTTKGWGLMQLILTPKKIRPIVPDKNDYSYAGALIAVHTIHTANERGKINLHTEWIVGMLGPPSFAKQTQIFFHDLIKNPRPMGWDYQLPTDLLLNYNIGVEKQLAGIKNISFIGGAELFFGSMKDALSFHLLLQIGNKNGYFSGLTNQYFAANKPELSVSLRTSADLILYNALLEGGIFNKESPVRNSHSKSGTSLQRLRTTGSLDLFILFSTKKFAVSLTQKTVSTEFKGYGSHSIGNISIYKPL